MAHILVVEDEARMRDIIRDYFTAHGLDCDLARDGAEGLDLLRESPLRRSSAGCAHAQSGRLPDLPGHPPDQQGAHPLPYRPGG